MGEEALEENRHQMAVNSQQCGDALTPRMQFTGSPGQHRVLTLDQVLEAGCTEQSTHRETNMEPQMPERANKRKSPDIHGKLTP